MSFDSRTGLVASCAMFVISGCTNVSGLGGSSSYACLAPEGVTCNSVSGVYANAVQDNLPSQRGRTAAPGQPASAVVAVPGPSVAATVPTLPSDELRSRPRVLRLWFKPWEDADNDLVDQGYVYVRIDAGQWRLDHLETRIREGFAPVKPPVRGDGASPPPEVRRDPRPSIEAQEPRAVPRPALPRAGSERGDPR